VPAGDTRVSSPRLKWPPPFDERSAVIDRPSTGSVRDSGIPRKKAHMKRESLADDLVPLAARLLVSGEFVVAVNGKIFGWSGQAAYMTAHGMHAVAPLLGLALLIEAVGTLCLILGIGARPAAAIMFVYLGIVSVRLHDFWAMTGRAADANVGEFFKNLGMMGCLLMIAHFGAGRWALGALFAASRHTDVLTKPEHTPG
jgi:putative oxidoreductase